jgi:hypothetical protein
MPCNIVRARRGPKPDMRRAVVTMLVLVATGCAVTRAERPLARRVVAAQGGALESFRRESELRVHYGFPGSWRWRLTYRAPASFRLTLIAAAGEQEYASDGETVRGFVDGALLVSEPLSASPFRTHVRWMAVTSLAVLADGGRGVEVREPRGGDVTGPGRALEVVWPDGARFVLTVDGDGLVRSASGPIEIPSIGSGRLHARFDDYRRVGDRTLPFELTYRLNDEPFLDESVVAYDLAPPTPSVEAAETPAD